MKKIIIAFVLLISFNSFSQIVKPIKWKTSVVKTSDTEAELTATAIIKGNWHLYSQSVPKGGPVPTTFTYKSDGNYLKKGNTKEDVGTTINDKMFKMRIKYFSKKATFKQRIKLKTNKPFKVNAVVEYMVCDDTRCLPPTEAYLVFEVK